MGDAKAIKRIDASTVSRLNSGQVITDLASAVKELVENSLDAKATSIEIRFKEYGVESIEVLDNGSGIAQTDHESIALRAHTSKLESFDGLASVGTFGFRGEALASLCSLAKVVIATATDQDAPLGYSLAFDRRGALASTTREARAVRLPTDLAVCAENPQRGTSVSITRLFDSVPVRRKTLERNAKKDFAAVQTLLHAYALICEGVRFSLSNTDAKGKKTALLNTTGGTTMQTFTALFGAKAQQTMMPLNVDFDVEPEKSSRLLDDEPKPTTVRLTGFVSKPQPGQGRSSADRQFFYINGRPFSPSKIPRAVNEVYRSYNSHQSPCIIANFLVAADAYDVNLSPDKRTILIHSETNLIEALKLKLEDLFAPSRSTYSTQTVKPVIGLTPSAKPRSPSPELGSDPPLRPRRRSSSIASDAIDLDTPPLPTPTPPPVEGPPGPRSVAISIEPRQLTLNATASQWDLKPRPSAEPPKKKRKTEEKRSAFSNVVKGFVKEGDVARYLDVEASVSKGGDDEEGEDETDEEETRMSEDDGEEPKLFLPEEEGEEEEPPGEARLVSPALIPATLGQHRRPLTPAPPPYQGERTGQGMLHVEEEPAADLDRHLHRLADAGIDSVTDAALLEYAIPPHETHAIRSLSFDLEAVKAAYAPRDRSREERMNAEDEDDSLEVELAGLAVEDAEAEAALSRIFSQGDFATMQVCGQFNLGFIVARGRGEKHDDLWILDQHASDEKRNFEELQQTTKLQSQCQLFPRQLDLPSADELLVLDNLDVLKTNGFEVSVDEDAAAGSRISLVAHPTSKATIFGVSDLEELIHLLHDRAPGQVVRPARVRAMFAMRACRKSVMIGKALTMPQMTGIIRRMEGMKEPWSCPHGRPTMRWLATVKSDATWSADEAVDWSKLDA